MDAEGACRDLDLRLLEVYPSAYGLVARVEDAERRMLLLKQRQPQQHDCLDEAEAWRRWEGRDCVPELIADGLHGDLHLREFIDGVPLSYVAGSGSRQIREAGWLLRELHQPDRQAPQASASRAWMCREREVVGQGRRLSDAEMARFVALTTTLVEAGPLVLVHGDFYHRNILLTPRGLVAIDPLARADLAAADLATFALTVPAESPEATLSTLLEGYRSEPPLLAAYLAWAGLRNAHYRRAFDAGDGGVVWQACFVASGDAFVWSD